jgi:hypothetical protein
MGITEACLRCKTQCMHGRYGKLSFMLLWRTLTTHCHLFRLASDLVTEDRCNLRQTLFASFDLKQKVCKGDHRNCKEQDLCREKYHVQACYPTEDSEEQLPQSSNKFKIKNSSDIT